MDPKMEKWARVLVDYSCNIQKGEWVYLVTDSIESKPLYDAVRERIIQKGAYPSDHFCYDPFTVSSIGRQDYAFLKYASQEQLRNLPKFKLNEVKSMDATIIIIAPANSEECSDISSSRIVMAKSQEPLTEERVKKKWVITAYPTLVLARRAGMSLSDFEKFVYSALLVDRKNPIQEWEKLAQRQRALVDVLNRGEAVRILAKDTDLTMSIKGRIAESGDGHVNMPCGEVFTSPVEDSVNGTIFFGDFPIMFLDQEVRGIRLEFRNGKVVKASAEENNKFLQAVLDTDEGSRYLGELGIGTNFGVKKFVKEILFDEKMGGTIHLALGDGFEECGGKNKSAIHWDIVKDLRNEGAIYIDGKELIVAEDGIYHK